MSGDGGSARLKGDAGRVQMDELGVGGLVQEFDRLRKQQQRRRRKQHRVRQRDDGADRASVVRLLVGIVVGAGCCWADRLTVGGQVGGVERGLAGRLNAGAACAATPWKCPNESTNWMASANSASREPCLMFDRNHFMPICASHRKARGIPAAPTLQYNIARTGGRCQPESVRNG